MYICVFHFQKHFRFRSHISISFNICLYIYMSSWSVKDTTTFEMELCGAQTGRSAGTCTTTLCVIDLWTHQKFESFKKKIPQRRKSNSNLLINSKTPRNRSNLVSGRMVLSLLHLPPMVLPRNGNNVVRLVTRESYQRCFHLLQHKLQILYSSFLVRHDRQKFPIDELCRDFPRLFTCPLISDSLITQTKNASVFCDFCWKSSSLPENSFGRHQDLSHQWDLEYLSELGLW